MESVQVNVVQVVSERTEEEKKIDGRLEDVPVNVVNQKTIAA
jgi:hypothetical protein